VPKSGFEELRSESLAAVRWLDVHSPEVGLVGGLLVRVAEEAERAHERIHEGSEDDLVRRAAEVRSQNLGIRGEVFIGRRSERKRCSQQRFATDRAVGAGIPFAKGSDHGVGPLT